MTRLLFLLTLMTAMPVYAADAVLPIGARLIVIKPGESIEMTISADIQQSATITEDNCGDNCDMVVYGPEQPHPCEINPEQTGCAYYQIEPAGGVYE